MLIHSPTKVGRWRKRCGGVLENWVTFGIKINSMPVICMFYGIIVRMFFMDNKEHKLPHIHVEYGEFNAVVALPGGELLAGNFPNDKMKLVTAWIEIHKDELMADWKLAVSGQPVFKIDALK